MTYSIDQFKSQVSRSGGFARGNFFSVTLPAITGATVEELNVLCKGVSIPGKQIMTQERSIGIHTSKVAYGYVNDEVTLQFHVMNDWKIRNYFEAWQRLAVNEDTGEVGYYNDYKRDVRIHALRKGFSLPIYKKDFGSSGIPSNIINRLPQVGPFDFGQTEIDLAFITEDDIAYSCTLQSAHPTTISPIQLADEASNQLIELTVSLTYRRWVNGNSVLGDGGLLSSVLTDLGIF